MFDSTIFNIQTESVFSRICAEPNHRGATRFGVKWRVAVALDEHNIYHGRTRDLSSHGASILLPVNISHAKMLDLHIHIPAPHAGVNSSLLHIKGKLIYVVYDSRESSFRAGIEFHEFKSQHGAEYLLKHLSLHHRPLGQ